MPYDMKTLWWILIIVAIVVVVVPIAVFFAVLVPFVGMVDDIELNKTAEELDTIIAMFREMDAAAAFTEASGNVHDEIFTEEFPGGYIFELETADAHLRIEYSKDDQAVTGMAYTCTDLQGMQQSTSLGGDIDADEIATKIRSAEC